MSAYLLVYHQVLIHGCPARIFLAVDRCGYHWAIPYSLLREAPGSVAQSAGRPVNSVCRGGLVRTAHPTYLYAVVS